MMEESLILAEFDRLVQSGIVLYDNNQQVVEHIDGELKVHMTLTLTHLL